MEMMWAREDGIPLDKGALEQRIREGSTDAVARQVQGRHRQSQRRRVGEAKLRDVHQGSLTGFGGTGNTYVFQDVEAFPSTKARVLADPGRKHRRAPPALRRSACSTWRRRNAMRKRLKEAVQTHKATGAFITAASPA
jgi:5-methyltetrahydropteroyltriglutamate--homocysteine methyltransferase